MRICIMFLAVLIGTASFGQKNILTKEGRPILNRSSVITNCLKSLNKDRSDKTALAICECQVSKLDRRFTNRQYQRHTDGNVININALIKEDSVADKAMNDCFTNSGKTMLLQAEGFENEFVANCEETVLGSSEKQLDKERVHNFCTCQLQLVKTRKLSDAEMRTLVDPNSVLFYEMIYTCGNPFAKKTDVANYTSSEVDIKGPPATDTIPVLNLSGMTYVKMKIGAQVKVWLFDTGASDLLVSTEMEEAL